MISCVVFAIPVAVMSRPEFPAMPTDSLMTHLQQLQPFDEHNQHLQASVAPPDWKNPTPTGRYHLVVIGAGTAGLVTAAGAAGLGARVALVERELMGGDCLNVGCVPSKAIIEAARTADAIRRGREFGFEIDGVVEADFSLVMDRMRRVRASIGPHDAAKRFAELGVDVYFGDAAFVGTDGVQVGDLILKYKRAVICTGARAADLSIPGLQEVGALTNETVFSLTELPPRFAVIGAGPVGCEMAQSFARFGSKVTLFESSNSILAREDREAAKVVQDSMTADGVHFEFRATATGMTQSSDGTTVSFLQDGSERSVVVDKVLVGIGRTPNVHGIGLEEVGVRFDAASGVEVNDRLQTTNPKIYAAGDVCSRYKFTHAADFMARIVIQNTLFWGCAKTSGLTIPWCTYTSPELAHVGMQPHEAASQGVEIDTYLVSFRDVDRSVLSGETEGFVKAHVRKGTDEILGATIVASHAGDMIGEITLAMTLNASVPRWKRLMRLQRGVGLSALGSTIHPYPTEAEAIRKLGDQYNRTRLTPLVRRLLQTWLRWTG